MKDHLRKSGGTEDPAGEEPASRWRIRCTAGLAAVGASIQALPSFMSGPLAWLVTLMAMVPAGGMVLVQANDWSRRRRSRRPVRLSSRSRACYDLSGSRRAPGSQRGRENWQVIAGGSVKITVGSTWRSVLLSVLVAVILVGIVIVLVAFLTMAPTDRTLEPPPSDPPRDRSFSNVAAAVP